MADGSVDKLNIQISADAQRASRAMDRLSSSLIGMDKAVKRLNDSGFSKLSTTLNGFANSISKLDGIQIPDLSGAVQSLEKLGDIKVNDNGINKTINALNRLVKADLSSFNPENFQKITESIGALGSIPDVSSGVNRFVSSIARLANAGEKTGQSASGLANLGRQLKKTVGKFSGIKNISPEVNTFVSSMSRLANAGGKTGQTAAGLKDLADKTLDFFKTMQKAPKVSENTIRMTQALAQLASAGGRVGTATSSMSSAFAKLSSASTKAGNLVKKAASKITSAIKSIGSSKPQLDKTSSGFGNLFKSILPLLGIRQVFSWAKDAVMLGSDIAEVENVVDVSFGSMADKAYEFAATAKEQFGLSELAAKQYAGTMMAMLNSTGVAQDAAAEMSTTLAGLAGDLASFYNISTDEAFMKLRSAIAGETEPMRQLGVNMTVATLESYALSQGITKSWQSMTQAEQAMLRYNYLMSATAQQQGDFTRTQASFANQARILALNFQTLGATIGQGFIAAILPAIQALNALMAVLQRAAEAFRNFIYVLTGYEGIGSQSGVVNEFAGLEDIGSAGSDAAGGIEDASDAAKDLKENLTTLPFDELNQLSKEADSLGDSLDGSSGSGGGIGGLTGGGLGNISDAFGESELPKAVNEWAERIRKAFTDHDWDKLGEEIAWGINIGLQAIYDAINWNNVGPKITAFITAFTQTFNSLVDNIDWDLMGRTVGAGINTIVNTVNLLIGPEGIDFKLIGTKISEGFRGMIGEIQWTNLGNMIGNGFMIAWNMLSGFVTDMSQKDGAGITGWEQLGISIANAVNGVFNSIDFGTIGLTLASGFNGVFETLRNFTQTVNWDDIAVNIYTGLNNMIHTVNWAEAGKSLSEFVTDLLGTFKKVAENTDWEGLGKGIGDFLGNIDWIEILTDVGTIIYEAASGILSGLFDSDSGSVFQLLATFFVGSKLASVFFEFGNAVSEAMTGQSITENILSRAGTWFSTNVIPKILPAASSLLSTIGTWVTGTLAPTLISGISTLGATLLSPAGLAIAGAIVGGILIWKNWDKIKEWAGKAKEAILNAFDKAKDWLKQKGSDIMEGLKNGWESVKESKLGETVSGIGGYIKEKAGDAKEWLKQKGSDAIEGFNNAINDNYTTSQTPILGWASNIMSWFTSGGFGGINNLSWMNLADDVIKGFNGNISKDSSTSQSPITNWASNIISWFTDDGYGGVNNSNWQSFAGDAISGFVTKIGNSYTDAKDGITTWASGVKDWFTNSSYGGVNNSNWQSFANNAIEGFRSKIGNAYTSTKSNITTWASKAKDWFTSPSFGGINSSSWQSFAGDTIEGFRSKIGNAYTSTKSNITTWASKAKDWFSGSSYGGVNSSTFWGYAANAINGFKDKIGLSYTDAKTNMEAFGEDVKTWFTNFVSGSKFYDIASDVIDGFKDGIGDLYDTCKDTIEDWGGSIIGWFKERLDSNSPSKVFEEIGKDTVRGYNIGITSLESSTKKIVGDWTDSFTDVSPNMGVYVDTSALKHYNSENLMKSVSASMTSSCDITIAGFKEAMREFYSEYVSPTIIQIAADVRRQADKNEQTLVQIGNRAINDAVVTQQKANGFRFVAT